MVSTKNSLETSLQERLYLLQNNAFERKISFYVIIEGWAQSGKGQVLQKTTARMDPRKLKVYSPLNTEWIDSRYPFQYKYWNQFPQKGIMLFLLKSWYYRASFAVWKKLVPKNQVKQVLMQILRLEKVLADDGIHIIKYFLDIEKKELKNRIQKAKKASKLWQITEEDKIQLQEYDLFQNFFESYRKFTDQPYAPWVVLESGKNMELQLMENLIHYMEMKLNVDSSKLLERLQIEVI